MSIKKILFVITILLAIGLSGSIQGATNQNFVFTGIISDSKDGLSFTLTNQSSVIQVDWNLQSQTSVASVLETMFLYPFDSTNEIEAYYDLGGRSTGTAYFYRINERSAISKYNLSFSEVGIDNSAVTSNYNITISELNEPKVDTFWSGTGIVPQGMSAFQTGGLLNITWNAVNATTNPFFVLGIRDIVTNANYFITDDFYTQQNTGVILANTVHKEIPAGTYYFDPFTTNMTSWNISVMDLGISTVTATSTTNTGTGTASNTGTSGTNTLTGSNTDNTNATSSTTSGSAPGFTVVSLMIFISVIGIRKKLTKRL